MRARDERYDRTRSLFALILAVAWLCAAPASAAQNTAGQCVVRGTVLTLDGSPARDADIGLAGRDIENLRRTHADRVLFTRADRLGRFELVVPRSTRWVSIVARIPGFARVSSAPMSLDAAELTVPPLHVVPLATTYIRIEDETYHPIAGVRVTVGNPEFADTLPSLPESPQVARSDREGLVAIAKLDAGKYYASADHEAYAGWHRELPLIPHVRPAPAPGADPERLHPDFVITLHKGVYVDGIVTDAAGRPLRAVTLTLAGHPPKPSTTTDARGHFRFGPVGADYPTTLVATVDGFSSDNVTIQPGQSGTLALIRTAQFRGRVVDVETRKPVEAFSVVVYPRGADRHDTPLDELSHTRAFTSARGTFEWPDPDSRPSAFVVKAPAYLASDPQEFTLQPGTAHEVIVELRPSATIVGRVIDKTTGKPIAGASVAHPLTVWPRFGERSLNTSPPAYSDAQGRFKLVGAPRGTVKLRVHANGYLDAVPEADSTRREPLEVALDLGARVSGRVFDQDGKTLAVANVSLSPEAGRSSQGSSTDEQGRFDFRNVAPGRYWIVATTTYARSDSKLVVVDGGEAALAVTLTLHASATLHGRVVGLALPEFAKLTALALPASDFRAQHPKLMTGGGDGSVKVDPAGHFSIQNLAGGSIVVTVGMFGDVQMTKHLDLPARGTTEVEFNFDEVPQIVGRIVRDGKPAAGIIVTAVPVGRRMSQGYATTDSDGQYRVRNIEDGVYELHLLQTPPTRVTVKGRVQQDFVLPAR
jgi:hypothetical protein